MIGFESPGSTPLKHGRRRVLETKERKTKGGAAAGRRGGRPA